MGGETDIDVFGFFEFTLPYDLGDLGSDIVLYILIGLTLLCLSSCCCCFRLCCRYRTLKKELRKHQDVEAGTLTVDDIRKDRSQDEIDLDKLEPVPETAYQPPTSMTNAGMREDHQYTTLPKSPSGDTVQIEYDGGAPNLRNHMYGADSSHFNGGGAPTAGHVEMAQFGGNRGMIMGPSPSDLANSIAEKLQELEDLDATFPNPTERKAYAAHQRKHDQVLNEISDLEEELKQLRGMPSRRQMDFDISSSPRQQKRSLRMQAERLVEEVRQDSIRAYGENRMAELGFSRHHRQSVGLG